MDVQATRTNCLTGSHATAAMVPLDYETDREILDVALSVIGLRQPVAARLMWIQNTLKIAELECSEAYFDEARQRSDLEILTQPRKLPLRDDGQLPSVDGLVVSRPRTATSACMSRTAMSGRWSTEIENRYSLRLADDVRAWLDEQVWQESGGAEFCRAQTPEQLLDPVPGLHLGGIHVARHTADHRQRLRGLVVPADRGRRHGFRIGAVVARRRRLDPVRPTRWRKGCCMTRRCA